MNPHEIYMQRCIHLALLGRGKVAPNPMVGAVLVYDGMIIGEGFHEIYGQAHAEVNCINNAKQFGFEELIAKSTLYVSLEPCAHFGKTPPCADFIIAHQIPEVVIGCRDSFNEVDGKGIEKLRGAGVRVVAGVMERECRELNKSFFTFVEKRRPYIILKWAETANGRIGYADGTRLYITGDIMNRRVHRWRSEETAIMIGTNTALMDDPQLTNRLWNGLSPIRIVLDLNLRLTERLRLFNPDALTVVLNYRKDEQDGHVRYFKLSQDDELMAAMMKAMYDLKIQSVLVEGGTTLLQSFIDEGLWDEARILTNPYLSIEGGVPAPVLEKGRIVYKDEEMMEVVNEA